jgi:hypothetical protein
MFRQIVVISLCMMLLTACSTTTSTSPDPIEDTKEKVEKIFDMEIAIPQPKGMFISEISINYPLKDQITGEPNGNFYTVNVGYSFDRGTLREITAEEIEWRKKNQQPEILYGPYKTEKSVITLRISNVTYTNKGDSEMVMNTPVQYKELKRGDRTILMTQFFPKEGHYLVTCNYEHGLTEKDCRDFVHALVREK